MTSSVRDHWSGQSRNVESRPLGENGNHTPQTGSDQTWKCLNFNQKKIRVCVGHSGGGRDQKRTTRTDLNAPSPETRLLQWMHDDRKLLEVELHLKEKGSELQGAVITDRECLRVRRAVVLILCKPHIMIPSLSLTPAHKCQHLQGDLKTSALYNNTALPLIRSNSQNPSA